MNTQTAVPATEIPAILTPAEFMQEVRAPLNWHDWLHLAKAAVTLDQKLGLLHTVFNVDTQQQRWWDESIKGYRIYVREDRLKFLFIVADGWKDSSNFDWRKPEERFARGGWIEEPRQYFVGYSKNGLNRVERTDSEQRQVLARKAFDLLCHNFFIIDETPEYKVTSDEVRYRRLNAFVSGPLFPVVQGFYRIEKDGDVRNLTWPGGEQSPHEKHAVAFLLKLAEFLWEWREEKYGSWISEKEKSVHDAENARVRKIVEGARPWMIEVLEYMRELKRIGKWLAELDQASVKKLKEIALRSSFYKHSHPVEKDRPAQSIDEACYLGSAAGWLLKRHELLIAENARLTNLLNAECKANEAAKTVTRLRKRS